MLGDSPRVYILADGLRPPVSHVGHRSGSLQSVWRARSGNTVQCATLLYSLIPDRMQNMTQISRGEWPLTKPPSGKIAILPGKPGFRVEPAGPMASGLHKSGTSTNQGPPQMFFFKSIYLKHPYPGGLVNKGKEDQNLLEDSIKIKIIYLFIYFQH